ncbi:DUF1778 domain-containing protein [Novosphingobium sp. TCA1]|uniref:type II toxin -antitoxin system TacA 1-like antitoxin n=1 Tax=Novosphingobium sp. TCA1 TaxID=2682474 RepID=UPI00130BF942|nr:DUF1778 domain-containing protein [Novosphingobium sp. TCA1]GFE77716.1 hypothetical protein NTCA1_53650 [Novosphingobium sp. TCA1]
MAPSPTVGFRLSPELKDALERAAAEDDRTVSQYVVLTLTRHLQEKGYLAK